MRRNETDGHGTVKTEKSWRNGEKSIAIRTIILI